MNAPWNASTGEFERLQESLRAASEDGGSGDGPYLMCYPLNLKTSRRMGVVAFLKGEALAQGPLGLSAILGPGTWHVQAHNGRRAGEVVSLQFEGAPRRILWESPLILRGEPANVPQPWGDLAAPVTATPAAPPAAPPAATPAADPFNNAAQLLGLIRAMQPPTPPPPPPPPDMMTQMRTMAEFMKAVAPPQREPSFLDRHGATVLTVGGSLLTGAITSGMAAASGLAPYLVDAVVGQRKAAIVDKITGAVLELGGKFLDLAKEKEADEVADDENETAPGAGGAG